MIMMMTPRSWSGQGCPGLSIERPSEGKAGKNPLNLYSRLLVTLVKAVSMEIQGQKLVAKV